MTTIGIPTSGDHPEVRIFQKNKITSPVHVPQVFPISFKFVKSFGFQQGT
jgi:hypothetical protein